MGPLWLVCRTHSAYLCSSAWVGSHAKLTGILILCQAPVDASCSEYCVCSVAVAKCTMLLIVKNKCHNSVEFYFSGKALGLPYRRAIVKSMELVVNRLSSISSSARRLHVAKTQSLWFSRALKHLHLPSLEQQVATLISVELLSCFGNAWVLCWIRVHRWHGTTKFTCAFASQVN